MSRVATVACATCVAQPPWVVQVVSELHDAGLLGELSVEGEARALVDVPRLRGAPRGDGRTSVGTPRRWAGKATPRSDVVVEATYAWYWAVDLLQDMGYQAHLAHPRANNGKRRVKNDERDARDLGDLLRLGTWLTPGSPRTSTGSRVSWCASGPSCRTCAPA